MGQIELFDWFLWFQYCINLHGLFNAKAILLEEQQWHYLTHSWKDKGVPTFPMGICLKVNVIAQLEFKLTYYDSAVQHFNYYTTRTPPELFDIWIECKLMTYAKLDC